MEKQIGGKHITIPEQKYFVCHGCEFLERKMLKSGRDPIYGKRCIHPSTTQTHSSLDGEFTVFRANLHENMVGFIEVPDWCPVQKQENDTAWK